MVRTMKLHERKYYVWSRNSTPPSPPLHSAQFPTSYISHISWLTRQSRAHGGHIQYDICRLRARCRRLHCTVHVRARFLGYNISLSSCCNTCISILIHQTHVYHNAYEWRTYPIFMCEGLTLYLCVKDKIR
jgi:hypothetical protein